MVEQLSRIHNTSIDVLLDDVCKYPWDSPLISPQINPHPHPYPYPHPHPHTHPHPSPTYHFSSYAHAHNITHHLLVLLSLLSPPFSLLSPLSSLLSLLSSLFSLFSLFFPLLSSPLFSLLTLTGCSLDPSHPSVTTSFASMALRSSHS